LSPNDQDVLVWQIAHQLTNVVISERSPFDSL